MKLQAMVVANISGETSGDRSTLDIFQLINQPDPAGVTQLNYSASQHYFQGSDIWVPYASACTPYEPMSNLYCGAYPTSQQPHFENFSIPFTHANAPYFKSEQKLLYLQPSDTNVHISSIMTTSSDVYLMGQLFQAINGARGYLKIWLNPTINNGTITGTLYGGASIHYYTDGDRYVSQNSFCLPLAAGTSWAYEYCSSNPAFYLELRALELNTSNAFGTGNAVAFNTLFTAGSDGFLHGFVAMNADGDRSTIQVVNGHSPEVGVYQWKASASQHQYQASDVYVPINSATIPLKAGDTYMVEAQASSGSPDMKAYFTPVAHLF